MFVRIRPAFSPATACVLHKMIHKQVVSVLFLKMDNRKQFKLKQCFVGVLVFSFLINYVMLCRVSFISVDSCSL